MEIGISDLISGISVVTGVVISTFYARKAKRAEVEAQEVKNASGHIVNAGEMVDLVKKTYQEVNGVKDAAIESLRSEIELLRNERKEDRETMQRLIHALESIDSCDHRIQCPVINELQEQPAYIGNGGKGAGRKRASRRDRQRHGDPDSPGSIDDTSIIRV